MINVNELKRQAFESVREARKISEKAVAEKREMTFEERTQANKLLEESDNLTERADREAEIQKRDMAAASEKDSRKRRAIDTSDEDRAFLKFIREGKGALNAEEQRALVEDTEGQYLVSPEIDEDLQRSVAKYSVIRQLASKRLINKDRVIERDISEAAVGWGKLETGGGITETNPVPAQSYKYVEDLYGLVKIGEDELQDSDHDLIAFISDSFGRSIAEAENLAFIKGSGHGSSQPEGICLNATLLTNTKTTTDPNKVCIEDFLQMVYEVPVKFRQGSSFIVHSSTELELRKIRPAVGEGYYGNFMWQPSSILGAPNTFLGFPIYNQDDMHTLAETEGVIGIFGNFQYGYRIIDRGQIAIKRLDELYAESGLVGFIAHCRVGGYCLRPANKALVLLTEDSA